MLTGVLLHQIEAVRPVDLQRDLDLGPQGRSAEVDDLVALLKHVQDRNAGDRAAIARLAAAGGIEDRPVKHHAPAPLDLTVVKDDCGGLGLILVYII